MNLREIKLYENYCRSKSHMFDLLLKKDELINLIKYESGLFDEKHNLYSYSLEEYDEIIKKIQDTEEALDKANGELKSCKQELNQIKKLFLKF